MPPILDHVLVLGGSAAGMLAAGAIAPHVRRVTLVERDVLAGSGPRKGLPQARHANNLTPVACTLMEGWFPGIIDALVAAGATSLDPGGDAIWVLGDRPLARASLGRRTLLASRALLDGALRDRLRSRPGLVVRDGVPATGLAGTARAITGVTVRGADGDETIAADLVVDASGRGSRVVAWAAGLGASRPPEQRYRVGVRYATRIFRGRRAPDGVAMIVVAATAARPRGAVAFAIEDARWLVTTFGYGGEAPPPALADFRRFVAELQVPALDAIAAAEPLDDGAVIGFGDTARVGLERWRDAPDGLVVLGDAACALNPCYGRGITAAALQVDALVRELARGGPGLPGRSHRAVAAAAAPVFELQQSIDAAIPGVTGAVDATPPPIRWLVRRARRVGERDPVVARTILQIGGCEAPRSRLLRPDVLWRVLRAAG